MSSFGPNAQTQQAMTQLGSNAPQTAGFGGQLVAPGIANTNTAANFFRTLFSGDRASTTAALQPDINRIREGQQQTLQAASTLMPRGGGRSGTLFQLPFQTNSMIQNLFNGARTAAGTALGNLGLGQANAGTGLFNTSNQAAGDLGQLGQRQQQQSSSLWGGLGKGLLGLGSLITAPFTGGASLLTNLFR